MAQRDLVALGLASAVLAGLWALRRPDAAPAPGDVPGPAPVVDPNVAQARGMITLLEGQAAGAATPELREMYAQQLDGAADKLTLTSPQAAQELRDAAARIRRLNPQPGAAGGFLGEYEGLKRTLDGYLRGGAQQGVVDPTTLMNADRVARLIYDAGFAREAGELTELANQVYMKAGIERPIAMAL